MFRLEYVLEEFLDIQGYPQGMRLYVKTTSNSLNMSVEKVLSRMRPYIYKETDNLNSAQLSLKSKPLWIPPYTAV